MKSNCPEITPLPLGKPPRVLPSRGELLESPFEGGARFIGWGMSEKAKTKISLPNTVGIEMTLNL